MNTPLKTLSLLTLPCLLASMSVTAQMLEEVIVTAQKRAESLQDVPISISVIGGDEISKLRIGDTTQMASQIPNVQIVTNYGESQPSFSVRGITMADWSQNQSSPVAMYVDGVYKGLGALQSMQLYDLARIEVLRGPQGTLYGKNATGGAVNLITVSPELDGQWRGNLTVGAGNFDLFQTSGAIEGSNEDAGFGVRTAFIYSEADGWVENDLPGRDNNSNHKDYAVRVTARYQPVDTLDVLFRVHDSKRRMDAWYEVLANNIGPGGIGFSTNYFRTGLDYFEGQQERPDQTMKVDNSGASLSLSWDINADYTFDSITSYDTGKWTTREDADGSPFDVAHADYISDVDSMAQEFRLTSNLNGNFNFILGAYAQLEKVNPTVELDFLHQLSGDADGNGQIDCLDDLFTGCIYSNDIKQDKESYAIYTQGTWNATDALDVTVGVRLNKDIVEIKEYNAWIGYFDPDTMMEIKREIHTIDDYSDKTDDDNISYRFALDYQLLEEVAIYASFTTGFRNSAYNGQAFVDPAEITIADPEEVDAWEVGFKSNLADGRIRFNGAAFYYEYKDQQFLNVTPEFLQILVNAEKSTVAGIEFELAALPTENLELRAGLGLLDTEYDKLDLLGQDLSGNDLINAPEINFNAMADWYFAQTEQGRFFIGADTVYVDDQYFTAFNDDFTAQEGYWVSNARLGYQTDDSGWEVLAWVKNLADKEYITSSVDLQGSFNYVYNHRGATRTYGAEVRYRF